MGIFLIIPADSRDDFVILKIVVALMPGSIFNEFAVTDLAIKHMAAFIEFENHFNLLETMPGTNQHLAADVIWFVFFIHFQTWFVIDVNLPLNDFSTALAFNRELIEFSQGSGRGEKVLKEIHGNLHLEDNETLIIERFLFVSGGW
jgi:hypothetical protein